MEEIKKEIERIAKENPELENSIKIVVGIDMPEEIGKEYGITEDEIKDICGASSAVVYKILMDYMETKKGKKGKENETPNFYS